MSHRITDVVAWEAGNKNIARRNLIWSVAAEHIGFSAGDKFLLGATARLVGACLRIPYTLATATFGGPNRTVFSAFVLLIPTGVPMIQLVGLLVIATAGSRQPYWVCALAVAGIGAALYMDNLEQHRIDLTAMGAILRDRDTWVISLLYIGTFGSFVGFAFAFVQVLQINFAAGGQGAAKASLHAAQIAFVGPLLGSVSRVYGGKLADRIGGGRVTLWVFAGMILGAGVLVGVSTLNDHTSGPATAAMLGGYVVGFIALFLLSGIGNGSVYKMIPSIFEARSRSLNVSESERVAWSRALIGFAGAVGALGGVGINLALRQSYLSSHSATSAFWIFLAFYALASVVTWLMYVRRPVSVPVAAAESVPDLARA